MHQSSKIFGLGSGSKTSALDEANARIDREDKARASNVFSSSAGTEAFDMSEISSSASPMMSTRYSHDCGENGEVGTPKSLRRAGRSVTFSEENHNGASAVPVPNGPHRKPNSVLKKKGHSNNRNGKAPLTDSIIEEDEPAFGMSKLEGSNDATREGEVETGVTSNSSPEVAAGNAPVVSDSSTA